MPSGYLGKGHTEQCKDRSNGERPGVWSRELGDEVRTETRQLGGGEWADPEGPHGPLVWTWAFTVTDRKGHRRVLSREMT